MGLLQGFLLHRRFVQTSLRDFGFGKVRKGEMLKDEAKMLVEAVELAAAGMDGGHGLVRAQVSEGTDDEGSNRRNSKISSWCIRSSCLRNGRNGRGRGSLAVCPADSC